LLIVPPYGRALPEGAGRGRSFVVGAEPRSGGRFVGVGWTVPPYGRALPVGGRVFVVGAGPRSGGRFVGVG
jgi:hypothetical protein